jgi:hypothetical protein
MARSHHALAFILTCTLPNPVACTTLSSARTTRVGGARGVNGENHIWFEHMVHLALESVIHWY